jgi:predicted ATPase
MTGDNRGRYLLRSWTLHNFKSIRDATVQLAPLTLIVGQNSAGKSTLLQSIMAVAQAAPATGEGFPLNGDSVRLGTYDETVHIFAPADDREIGIGAEFDFPPDVALGSSYRTYRGARTRPGTGEMIVRWEVRLKGSPEGQPGLTLLQSACMSVEVDGHRAGEVRARAHARKPRRRTTGLGTAVFRGDLTYEDGSSEELESVMLRAGFPQRAVREMDFVESFTFQWLTIAQNIALLSARERATRSDQEALIDTDIAQYIADDIQDIFETYGEAVTQPAFEPRLTLLLREKISKRPPFELTLGVRYQELAQRVRELSNISLRVRRGLDMPDELRQASMQALDFLRNSMQHLGPLRMDPQVVYTAAPTSLNGYIGSKGEYSAAVLQTNGNMVVVAPTIGGDLERIPLGEAVDHWAEYLGIGQQFRTTDKGRLGIELAVRQKDLALDLDLTSVGTGVSQLLPVLVMCLQAPQLSLLLIEQPELHLNPAVQQRLGDFFLAIARSGRQLIVETHSDYLLGRLRRRIAEDSTDDTQRLAAILYAERHKGVTRYRTVETDSFGGIEDWPDGFFDSAAEEAELLLRAGLRKRRLRMQADKVSD